MWFVLLYLITVAIYFGCAVYDFHKSRQTLPPFIVQMALIALIPAVNTVVMVGLLIAIILEKRK